MFHHGYGVLWVISCRVFIPCEGFSQVITHIQCAHMYANFFADEYKHMLGVPNKVTIENLKTTVGMWKQSEYLTFNFSLMRFEVCNIKFHQFSGLYGGETDIFYGYHL